MKLDKRKGILLLTLAVGVFFLFFYNTEKREKTYLTETGRTFGTFYKIIYESPDGKPIGEDFTRIFHSFDVSLSIFNDSSVISKINKNDTTVVLDEYFREVFEAGQQVSQITAGAFDMTVAPLVNAWGFGSQPTNIQTLLPVDSLLLIVGYEKIRIENDRIVKENQSVTLDASGIAKGYACDVIASFLDSMQVDNYMVEIGGEVVVKGRNAKGDRWAIGITRPIDDTTMMKTELQNIVYLERGGMATSGNYRQFYYKDGKKYAHTIDPRTGYPVDHNLLSATVIAPNCMLADAYATAFMVMGLEESLLLANYMPGIEAYFVYADSVDNLSEKYTAGFDSYLNPSEGNGKK